ncbi:MAG: hypothetical protein A2Z27_01400 [candidate division Zixibacteria bacterium RBG_16_50_21]|nr:MAG: hypothetical protein A2Z27_01400 [candidate division Zixibacteria bacterium RBG_16_50_21]
MKRILVKLGILPEGKLSRREVVAHVKKKGWKWLLVVVAFYAVRDVILYILLPYLAVRWLIFGW